MKRIISLVLAVAMILGVLPVGEMVAFADNDKAIVDKIEMIRTYKGTSLEKLTIRITGKTGKNIKNIPVYFQTGSTDEKESPKIDTDIYRTYELIGKDYTSVRINGQSYSIDKSELPTISKTTPSNARIKEGEKITIEGKGFTKITGEEVEAFFRGAGDNRNDIEKYVENGENSENNKEIKNDKEIEKAVGNVPGTYDIVFKEETKKNEEPFITRVHNYEDHFTVYGDLNISDEINMTPNQGAPGTQVVLEADELIKDMSVFFKRNSDDIYDTNNMGELVNYIPSKEKNKYIFNVPNLDQGSYQVYLTNKVEKGQDPNKAITSEKTFKNNSFIIISDTNKPTISQISPSKGPATGIDATIVGRFLGSISTNIFTIEKGVEPNITPDKDSNDLSESLSIKYGDRGGSKVIGKYSAIKKGKDNKPVEVVFLERKVRGIIGSNVGFRKGSTLKNEGLDDIKIRVPQATDEETDPVKDVTLEMETTIEYQYKDEGGVLKKKQ